MNKLCLAVGMSLCVGLCGCGTDPEELFMKCKVDESSGEQTQDQIVGCYKKAVEAGSPDAAVYMAYHELKNNNIVGARTYAEKFKNDHPADYDIINGVYLIGDNLNRENAERGAELLSKAAKSNNVKTYFPLGEYYFKNKDYEKAVVNYELAVKNRDNRARMPLAKIYMDNLVPVDDRERIFRMIFQEQHDNPSRDTDLTLAKCFIAGWGTLPNLDKARNLVKKYSSRDNDLEAKFLELKISVMNPSPEISGPGIVKMKDFVRMTNYADAAYMLYEIYSQGLYGQYKDVKEAVHYVRIAQNYGNNRALVALARIYLDGVGVNKDENEAFSFARRAIEVSPNDAEAAYLIGIMYADGVGTKRDNEQAYRYLCQAAEAGNDDALFRKAKMIQEGRAPVENENEAVVIFENLAKKEHPNASYQYGELLFYGLGINRDVNQAITYLKKAANAGVTEAMFPLASAYDEVGDLESAITWYKNVAASEDINAAEASARVGDIYYEMHNYAEAEKYFKEAADKSHVLGTENLGRLYYTQGRFDDARDTFLRIAKNSSYAQTFLGIMYERGQGVQKNDVYASEWYDKAIAKGSADARYLEANLFLNSKTLPDELRSQVEPLLVENACHGHRESLMFLALTYYPSVGNADQGYGWLLYGAREYGMNDALSILTKVQTPKDYLEKSYEYAKQTCSSSVK